MYEPISVCIPTHNEQNTIKSTLESVAEQPIPSEREILVCTNGCDDRTEEAVKEVMQKYSNITLTSTKEKGKPNAWNILREEASYNYMFFTDGDVLFHPDAFKHLYDNLKSSEELIAAGAINVPIIKGRNYLTKLIAIPPKRHGSLVGRLYAFDNGKLQNRMEERGYTNMPSDILHEDFWLSLITGEKHWTINERSKVFYQPFEWYEIVDMRTRDIRSKIQIETEYPKLAEEHPDIFSKDSIPFFRWIARVYKNIQKNESIEDKAERILRMFIYKYADLRARSIIKHEKLQNQLEGWRISNASKMPFEVTVGDLI